MAKKNGYTHKTLNDPMSLQQVMMEAMAQGGAMGFGEKLAQHALKHNPRLKRLLNQYAEAALEQCLRSLGVTPER